MPTGTTTIVATAAVASVAAASRSCGTCAGRQRLIGCSISHHDIADSVTVASARIANSVMPVRPVRSPFSARKTGQCHR